MATTFEVATDSRGRTTLPEHGNKRYLVSVEEDGTLLLQPARVVTERELRYIANRDLQDRLADAEAHPDRWVDRPRRRTE